MCRWYSCNEISASLWSGTVWHSFRHICCFYDCCSRETTLVTTTWRHHSFHSKGEYSAVQWRDRGKDAGRWANQQSCVMHQLCWRKSYEVRRKFSTFLIWSCLRHIISNTWVVYSRRWSLTDSVHSTASNPMNTALCSFQRSIEHSIRWRTCPSRVPECRRGCVLLPDCPSFLVFTCWHWTEPRYELGRHVRGSYRVSCVSSRVMSCHVRQYSV